MKNFYTRSLRYRAAYIAGAAAFGLLLLYVCTRPHSVMERWRYPDISDLFDATNHFIGFTVFNFLVLSALLSVRAGEAEARIPSNNDNIRPAVRQPLAQGTPLPSPKSRAQMTALLLAVGLTWGFICEVIQLFVPSRSFQFMDVGANTLPSLLVFCIFNSKAKKLYEKV